jgi:hypothetical protein
VITAPTAVLLRNRTGTAATRRASRTTAEATRPRWATEATRPRRTAAEATGTGRAAGTTRCAASTTAEATRPRCTRAAATATAEASRSWTTTAEASAATTGGALARLVHDEGAAAHGRAIELGDRRGSLLLGCQLDEREAAGLPGLAVRDDPDVCYLTTVRSEHGAKIQIRGRVRDVSYVKPGTHRSASSSLQVRRKRAKTEPIVERPARNGQAVKGHRTGGEAAKSTPLTDPVRARYRERNNPENTTAASR